MPSRLPFLALALVSALCVAACGDDSPTEPSGPTTTTEVFSSTLSPANEVPVITNQDATASGSVRVTLHENKDAAGVLTSVTADFSVQLAGFPAGTTITAAHIHPGAAGINGSPLVNLGLTAGEVTITNGAGTITKTAISFSDLAQAQAFIANPANFYFNVHTSANSGGAIRGQLAKTT
jgi:hypothetical protein